MTGILEQVAADVYHADQLTDVPTLSASVAKILIAQSPLHAFYAHPRLNPDYERKTEERFDVGTACHALLLEGREAVQVIAADSWRTDDAKAMRDDARAAGKVPMLTGQWAEVQAMCAAVRDQLAALDVEPPLFDAGKPERTLVWEDSGVTCRARLDWLRDDGASIDDLKTTARSANPEQWSRSLFGMGYDVQACFYMRGVKAVTGTDAEFRLAVVETSAPYALSVISLMPAALEVANAKVDYALKLWRECLESGRWPGYPTRVCYAEMPSYLEFQWLEKEGREAA